MGILLTSWYVTSWYVVNIGMVMLNKAVVSQIFMYPVTLTLVHQAFCWLMGEVCVRLGLAPRQELTTRKQTIAIIMLSQAFSASIVMGIWALKYIPVSFDQAIGATTPAFTAILAVVIVRRWEQPLTYATLIPVILGVMIASRGEPGFHLAGFLLCVASTVCRGLKAVLQQVLLSEDGVKLDSLNALRLMCPWSVLGLVPAVWLIEGTEPWDDVGYLWDNRYTSWGASAVALNIVMAFLVNLLNLLVTKHTNALTIQVLGNAKGVVAAVISVFVFKNDITVTGALGYFITVMGTAL